MWIRDTGYYTRVAQLAWEADRATGKRHRGRQDDSGASEDEAEDGASS
jgi:hypothetical protein